MTASRHHDLQNQTNEFVSTTEGDYHDIFHHKENHAQLKLNIVYCMIPVIMLGILGNVLSLSVWTRRSLRHGRMAQYMSLLAIADMCALTCGIFIRILPDVFSLDLHNQNVFSCYFQYYFLGFFSCISAWVLIIMTIERFAVIAAPFKSSQCLSYCKASHLIALVVVLSALANVPLILINSWDAKAQDNCLVNEASDDTVKLVIFTLYSPVPILFLLFLNIAIISKVNQFASKIDKDPDSKRCISKQSSRGGSITSTNAGGIALALFRINHNIADERGNPNLKPINPDPRKVEPAQEINSADGKETSKPTQCLPLRKVMLRSGNNHVIDSIHPRELASISECTTPDEEDGIYIIDLPDVVTKNLARIEESDSKINILKNMDLRIGETREDHSINTDSFSYNSEDITLPKVQESSTCHDNLSYQEPDITAAVGETRYPLPAHISRRPSLDAADAAEPDIIYAHSPGHRDTLRISGSRRGSYPLTVKANTDKNHRLLDKRQSSISLFVNQVRVKSEHLAEKYNKIRNKKMAIMLLTVTLSYFLLTTPYMVTIYLLIYMSSASNHDHLTITQTQENIYLAQHVLELLLCMNHSINVVLYCATGSKFREEFKAMFMCKSKALRRFDTQSENHSPTLEFT